MRFQTIFLFAALASLHAIAPGSSDGQSQPPAATPQPAAASAPPSSASPKAQAALKAKAKPAKVWTNDEIDSLRNDHGVSVVGNRTPRNATPASKGYSLEKDPAWYRKQLEPLRAEIARLDGQIEKTKAFLSGAIVNDSPATFDAYFSVPGNPQDQLKQMEARRQADETKMDDLLDRARHNGIEPGALR